MDFETRADDERCFSCAFYALAPELDADHGWCTKHPRLNQKHHDKVHRTNWCEHYKRRTDMPKGQATPPTDAEVEEAVEAFEGNGETPELSDTMKAVVSELMQLRRDLKGFQHQLQQQLTGHALGNDNAALMESKGMLRCASMIETQIGSRIEALSGFPTMGKPQ